MYRSTVQNFKMCCEFHCTEISLSTIQQAALVTPTLPGSDWPVAVTYLMLMASLKIPSVDLPLPHSHLTLQVEWKLVSEAGKMMVMEQVRTWP